MPSRRLRIWNASSVASHPMAGRETSGIAHSAEVNFAPANFIITPTEKNSQAGIDWCRDLAAELGFKRISVLTPAEHDHMIGCAPAFTIGRSLRYRPFAASVTVL